MAKMPLPQITEHTMKRIFLAALLGLACSASQAAGQSGQSAVSNASANL